MAKLAVAFACLLLLSNPAWVQARGPSLSLGSEKLAKAKGQAIKPRLPGMDRVLVASLSYAPDRGLDIYYPEGYDFAHPRGFVIAFNGLATEEIMVSDDGAPLKDLAMSVSWAMAIASTGLPVIAYDSFEPFESRYQAPASTARLLSYLRDNAPSLGLDMSRFAFFVLGPMAKNLQRALADPSAGWGKELRGAVFNWPILDAEILPAVPVPILVVKPDRATPGVRFTVDDWTTALMAKAHPLEIHHVPTGAQSYEMINDNEETRQAVARIMDFLAARLR